MYIYIYIHTGCACMNFAGSASYGNPVVHGGVFFRPRGSNNGPFENNHINA